MIDPVITPLAKKRIALANATIPDLVRATSRGTLHSKRRGTVAGTIRAAQLGCNYKWCDDLSETEPNLAQSSCFGVDTETYSRGKIEPTGEITSRYDGTHGSTAAAQSGTIGAPPIAGGLLHTLEPPETGAGGQAATFKFCPRSQQLVPDIRASHKIVPGEPQRRPLEPPGA